MKKLKLNAQVTAINTLAEMIFSISYVIVLAIMKGNNFYVFIYTQFFSSILFPFTFLSNTSENKDRILEVGWKNVMKNIIDNMKNHIHTYLRMVAETLSGRDIGTNRIQTLKNQATNEIIAGNDCKIKSDNKNEISTSRAAEIEITVKTTNEVNVPTQNSKQSCSKSLSSENREKCSSKDPKSTTYEQLDAHKLLSSDSNLILRKKMIANMSKQVNFEEKYLGLFKDFVAFQEGYITKEHLISNVLQTETPSPKLKQPSIVTKRKGKGRNSCSRNKSATVHPEIENNCTAFNKSKNVKDRIEMRLELLTDAKVLDNGNDGLEEMIERIITLEESFLEGS